MVKFFVFKFLAFYLCFFIEFKIISAILRTFRHSVYIFSKILLIFVLFFFACKTSPEYKHSSKGFDYLIHYENKNGKPLKENDIITVKLKYYKLPDSLLFSSGDLSGKFRIKISDAKDDGIFQDAVKMLKTGDSASFIIPANDFYLKTIKDSIPDFISPDEKLKFEIKVENIVSEKQLEKEYEQYLLKKEAEEMQILDEYIKSENISKKPKESGIYIIKLQNGKGKKAEIGKVVTINFTGKYINGKIFDSSIDKGKPLSFKLGNKYVIPAWTEVIQTMREGDKIRLIAPSKTAYGAEGLEDYVPPFTTLIYDIKLLKVK